jgi:hypothetical protein
MNLTGQCAVVLVVPGLLVAWYGPAGTGSGATISATVHMMCGCAIDDLFWPGANFDVVAIVTPVAGGNALKPIPLKWTAASTFTGQAPAPGSYSVQVFAVETLNGNTGSAAGSLTVSG